jgi:hypothetical protein
VIWLMFFFFPISIEFYSSWNKKNLGMQLFGDSHGISMSLEFISCIGGHLYDDCTLFYWMFIFHQGVGPWWLGNHLFPFSISVNILAHLHELYVFLANSIYKGEPQPNLVIRWRNRLNVSPRFDF